MTDFETALRQQIRDNKETKKAKRLLAFLDAPRTTFRKNILAKMEQHASVTVGKKGQVGFDWASIDWAKFFQQILSIIMALLPLFAAKKPLKPKKNAKKYPKLLED
jgi:hypothetical protein